MTPQEQQSVCIQIISGSTLLLSGNVDGHIAEKLRLVFSQAKFIPAKDFEMKDQMWVAKYYLNPFADYDQQNPSSKNLVTTTPLIMDAMRSEGYQTAGIAPNTFWFEKVSSAPHVETVL